MESKLLCLKLISPLIKRPPEQSLILFCDPRGGSTWLAEVLSKKMSCFIYWEPLAEINNPLLKELNFGWRQYIPINTIWVEAKKLFDLLFSAKFFTENTIGKFTIKQYIKSEFPLIKVCRANHALKWLLNQYKFKKRPIYLLRHPFAVVLSQLKQGGWDFKFEGFQIPNMPYNFPYTQHQEFLNSLGSKEEVLCAVWCITNRDNFDIPEDKLNILYYENLVIDSNKYFKRIFNEYGFEFDKIIEDNISKPSSTNVDYIGDSDSELQLSKWQRSFTSQQVENLQRVLNYFEIKIYSMESIYPILSNAKH